MAYYERECLLHGSTEKERTKEMFDIVVGIFDSFWGGTLAKTIASNNGLTNNIASYTLGNYEGVYYICAATNDNYTNIINFTDKVYPGTDLSYANYLTVSPTYSPSQNAYKFILKYVMTPTALVFLNTVSDYAHFYYKNTQGTAIILAHYRYAKRIISSSYSDTLTYNKSVSLSTQAKPSTSTSNVVLVNEIIGGAICDNLYVSSDSITSKYIYEYGGVKFVGCHNWLIPVD